MKIKNGVSRRKLLEMANGAMLLYPLIQVLKNSEAKAADGIIPRALFVHFSCGVYPGEFWPAGGTGPLGALPKILAPLEPHKNDLLVFKGVCTRGDTNHHAAPAQVLAGWGKKGGGVYPGAASSTPVPYSLDQMLGDRWGEKTLKKSVLLGTGTSSPTQLNFISYSKDGAGIPAIDNPKAAYDNLFGNFNLTTGGSNTLKLAQDNVASGRKRVIDYLRGDLKKISGALGETERRQFEAHVTSLDDIAKEIQKEEDLSKPTPGGGNTGGGNPNPGGGGSTSGGSDGKPARLAECNPKGISGLPGDPNQFPAVRKINNQIMLQAMACGLTRVGVLMYCVSDTTLDYGNGGSYHLASHGGGAGYSNAQASFIASLAEMVTAMKAVRIGDHSLFDETLIMGATDQGDDPNAHDGVNIASFFLGNLRGKLKGGRMISWPFTPRDWNSTTNGMDYNRLLITFASLVGESGITVVGNEGFKGVIPEIISG